MATEYVTHIVDAGHIRNIGEQSISNKIQAVLELVKNAYDGDAQECTVRFYSEDSAITRMEIEDSGVGMTKNDIRNKLMKVGTPHKINDAYSPKLKRRVSGAKGMGHYSMQRLGTKTTIITTPERYPGRAFYDHDDCTYMLEIDWDEYAPGRDFQDISHKLTMQKRNGSTGTKIVISGLKDDWNMNGDILHLAGAIGNIMLPKKLQNGAKDEFVPVIEPVGFALDLPEQDGNLLDYATYKAEAHLRGGKILLRTFRRKKDGKGHIQINSKSKHTSSECGDADFTLYWFSSRLERWAKGLFNSRGLEDQLKENCGIKIYNDGVRIMPYGEKGDDWMGMDARRNQRFGKTTGGKVHNAALIGTIELTRERNPAIIETTSREAIDRNEAFESLKRDFVMPVIDDLENEAGFIIKEEEKLGKKTEPGNIAQTEIDRAREMIDGFDFSGAEKKTVTAHLAKAYAQVRVQEEQKLKIKEELTANMEIYRNLATIGIQTIAFNHEIINPIRYVKATLTNLGNLHDEMPEEDQKKYILKSLERITHTLNWASRIKEFSSILAGADGLKKGRDTVDIYSTLIDLRAGLSVILDALDITMDDPVITGDVQKIKMNRASFESIFINLMTNSVRALKKVNRKRRIKIAVSGDSTHVIFEFEDNGCGIPDMHRDDIFNPFFTTYKGPDDLGTGMGLAILRDIVEEDYGGSVKLLETVCEADSNGMGMTKFVIMVPHGEAVAG